MKKFIITTAFVLVSSSSFAQNINTPVPMVPVYNYIPTPEMPGPYSPPGYPTQVPVAVAPNGQCAMYVDPYDLFGQIFGGADLVQSCWRPMY